MTHAHSLKKSPKGRRASLSHIHPDLRGLATPLDRLQIDPSNARIHDRRNLDAIAASLRKFGFRSPVIVRREGMVVLAGNGRCAVAKELGWTDVPAIVVDDVERDAALFALADNRTAELASWDERRLAEVMRELRDECVDAVWLWSEDEVQAILDAADGNDEADGSGGDVPVATERPKQPKTKPGDLFVLGRHRLICGDCTDAKTVARLLGGSRPVMMVTDPPYGVEYQAEWRGKAGLGRSEQVGRVANDDRSSWASAWSLFPGSIAYVWHAGLFAGEVGRSLEVSGFELRSQIIWLKRRFAISRGAYHWRHEPAWYAVRKGSNAAWAGGRKQDSVWGEVVDRLSSGSGDSMFACQITADQIYAFDARCTTVWEIPHDHAVGGGHSTQKPVEAMARPLRNHDAKEVYDPFLGTGTTLVASEKEGRACFGLEIDPGYCDVIVNRWEEMTGEKAKAASR